MSAWHEEFFERCCNETDGVAVGEGAFCPGPALSVGKREVAHFDDDRRWTCATRKAEILRRRDDLKTDAPIRLRSNSSDRLELTVQSDKDVKWAASVVLTAVEANRGTVPKGLPHLRARIWNVADDSTDLASPPGARLGVRGIVAAAIGRARKTHLTGVMGLFALK